MRRMWLGQEIVMAGLPPLSLNTSSISGVLMENIRV